MRSQFGGGTHFKPFGLAVGGTLIAVASAFWMPDSDFALIVAIAAIFLGLPLCILLYRDGLRAAHADGVGSPGTTTVLALPLRLLGLFSVIAGVGTFVWLGYNVLIERQPQFTGVQTVEQLLLPFTLIGFGYRWMRRPLSHSHDGSEAA